MKNQYLSTLFKYSLIAAFVYTMQGKLLAINTIEHIQTIDQKNNHMQCASLIHQFAENKMLENINTDENSEAEEKRDLKRRVRRAERKAEAAREDARDAAEEARRARPYYRPYGYRRYHPYYRRYHRPSFGIHF